MVDSRAARFDLPKRMVFVDDDPYMRDILKHIFGYEEEDEHFLVTCGSGIINAGSENAGYGRHPDV